MCVCTCACNKLKSIGVGENEIQQERPYLDTEKASKSKAHVRIYAMAIKCWRLFVRLSHSPDSLIRHTVWSNRNQFAFCIQFPLLAHYFDCPFSTFLQFIFIANVCVFCFVFLARVCEHFIRLNQLDHFKDFDFKCYRIRTDERMCEWRKNSAREKRRSEWEREEKSGPCSFHQWLCLLSNIS